MTKEARTTGDAPDKLKLGNRLEEVAWALFLIMTGALWLTPAAWAPEGTWLAGLGLILLGRNAARHLYRLGVSGFGIAVGLAALVAGVGRILGGATLFVPMLLIALGTAMAVRTIARTRRHAHAAGDSSGGTCC